MSLDTSPFTDPQWWSMCDAHMSMPEPLAKADLTKPFVYERRFGVFYVPFGCHQHAMSVLLAFQFGMVKPMKVAQHLRTSFSLGTADYWLEHTEGACFLSSVSKAIQAGRKGSLNAIERRILGSNIEYLF